MPLSMMVWSEREPGAWTECTESSYLMTMIYGGWTAFPLGINTDAERDALDAASGFPGIGNTYEYIDQGAMFRYGVALRTVPRASLSDRLLQPGRALAIAGSFGRLPLGHPMRRWAPNFVGGHAVCVVPRGWGNVLWLDPLAPDDHLGDEEDVTSVLQFADGWSGWNPREALAGELIPQEANVPTDFTGAKHEIPKVVRIREGAVIYEDSAGAIPQGVVEPGKAFDADLLGVIVDGRYLMRRLDRQGGAWWVDPAAIIPEAEAPFRRYTLDDGAAALLSKIRALLA